MSQRMGRLVKRMRPLRFEKVEELCDVGIAYMRMQDSDGILNVDLYGYKGFDFDLEERKEVKRENSPRIIGGGRIRGYIDTGKYKVVSYGDEYWDSFYVRVELKGSEEDVLKNFEYNLIRLLMVDLIRGYDVMEGKVMVVDDDIYYVNNRLSLDRIHLEATRNERYPRITHQSLASRVVDICKTDDGKIVYITNEGTVGVHDSTSTISLARDERQRLDKFSKMKKIMIDVNGSETRDKEVFMRVKHSGGMVVVYSFNSIYNRCTYYLISTLGRGLRRKGSLERVSRLLDYLFVEDMSIYYDHRYKVNVLISLHFQSFVSVLLFNHEKIVLGLEEVKIHTDEIRGCISAGKGQTIICGSTLCYLIHKVRFR